MHKKQAQLVDQCSYHICYVFSFVIYSYFHLIIDIKFYQSKYTKYYQIHFQIPYE